MFLKSNHSYTPKKKMLHISILIIVFRSKKVLYDDKNTRILTTCTKMCWCQRTFQVCVNLSEKRMKRTIQNEFYLKWYNPCLILWASLKGLIFVIFLHHIILCLQFCFYCIYRYIFHTTSQCESLFCKIFSNYSFDKRKIKHIFINR